jgi:thiol-disulfide isomerase/thioredoxin
MARPPLRAKALALALVALGISCTSPEPAANTSTPVLPATADALPTMDAATFAALVAAQEGTPMVVNFWASWCPPCKEETPDLVDAHHRWGDRVQFIGVDLSDDRDSAAAFMADHGVAYPSVFDPTNAIAVSYGLFSPPATVFYDAAGNRMATIQGQISPKDLETNIEAIAGSGAE